MKLTQPLLLLALTALMALATGCRPDKGPCNPRLCQIASCLRSNPDSAYRALLDMRHASLMPDADKAFYALLLAEATDKCGQSLESCEAWIRFAQHYYSDSKKEKATALLYRARLEYARNNDSLAIHYAYKALDILEEYPKEKRHRLLLYGSLGNWYDQHELHEKSIQAFRIALQNSGNAADSALSFYNLGYAYGRKRMADSAGVYLQKAVQYAQMSNDSSTLANCLGQYGLYRWLYKNDKDSASYYIHKACLLIPPGMKADSKFALYAKLANIYRNEGKKDSAYAIYHGALKEGNPETRITALGYLAEMKMEEGDYRSASHLLQQENILYDSLIEKKLYSDVPKLTYRHEGRRQMRKEERRYRRLIKEITGGGIIIILMLCILAQYRYNKKKRKVLEYELQWKQAQTQLAIMQKEMNENQALIKEPRIQTSSYERIIQDRIEEQEQEIKQLYHWFFTQTSIGKKVNELAQEKDKKVEQRKLLSMQDREVLTKALMNFHKEFTNKLRQKYPKINSEDLAYLCLKRMGCDSITIACCLGHTGTGALNQRKYRLKKLFAEEDRHLL